MIQIDNKSSYIVTGLMIYKHHLRDFTLNLYPTAQTLCSSFLTSHGRKLFKPDGDKFVATDDFKYQIEAILQKSLSFANDGDIKDSIRADIAPSHQLSVFVKIITVYLCISSGIVLDNQKAFLNDDVISLIKWSLEGIEGAACDFYWDDLVDFVRLLLEICIRVSSQPSSVPSTITHMCFTITSQSLQTFLYLSRSYSNHKKMFASFVDKLLVPALAVIASILNLSTSSRFSPSVTTILTSIADTVSVLIQVCLFNDKCLLDLAQHPVNLVTPFATQKPHTEAAGTTGVVVGASAVVGGVNSKKRGRKDKDGPTGRSAVGTAYYASVFSCVSEVMAASALRWSGGNEEDGAVSQAAAVGVSDLVSHLLRIFTQASWRYVEQSMKRSDDGGAPERPKSKTAPALASSLRTKHYCRVIQFGWLLLRACGADADISPAVSSTSTSPSTRTGSGADAGVSEDGGTVEGGDQEIPEKHRSKRGKFRQDRQQQQEPAAAERTELEEDTDTVSVKMSTEPAPLSQRQAGEQTGTTRCREELTLTQLRCRTALLQEVSNALSEAGSLPTHNEQVRLLICRLGFLAEDIVARLLPPTPAKESPKFLSDAQAVHLHFESLSWLIGVDHRAVIGWEIEDQRPLSNLIQAIVFSNSFASNSSYRGDSLGSDQLSSCRKLFVQLIATHSALSRLHVLMGEIIRFEQFFRKSETSERISFESSRTVLEHADVQRAVRSACGELSSSQLEMVWERVCASLHEEVSVSGEGEPESNERGVGMGAMAVALLVPLVTVSGQQRQWQLPVSYISKIYQQAVVGFSLRLKEELPIVPSDHMGVVHLLRLASQAMCHYDFRADSDKIDKSLGSEGRGESQVIMEEEAFVPDFGQRLNMELSTLGSWPWAEFLDNTIYLYRMVSASSHSHIDSRKDPPTDVQVAGAEGLIALILELRVFFLNASLSLQSLRTINHFSESCSNLLWEHLARAHEDGTDEGRSNLAALMPLMVRSVGVWDACSRVSSDIFDKEAILRDMLLGWILGLASLSGPDVCSEEVEKRLDDIFVDMGCISAAGGTLMNAFGAALFRAIHLASEDSSLLSLSTAGNHSSLLRSLSTTYIIFKSSFLTTLLPGACDLLRVRSARVIGPDDIPLGSSTSVVLHDKIKVLTVLVESFQSLSPVDDNTELFFATLRCLEIASKATVQLMKLMLKYGDEEVAERKEPKLKNISSDTLWGLSRGLVSVVCKVLDGVDSINIKPIDRLDGLRGLLFLLADLLISSGDTLYHSNIETDGNGTGLMKLNHEGLLELIRSVFDLHSYVDNLIGDQPSSQTRDSIEELLGLDVAVALFRTICNSIINSNWCHESTTYSVDQAIESALQKSLVVQVFIDIINSARASFPVSARRVVNQSESLLQLGRNPFTRQALFILGDSMRCLCELDGLKAAEVLPEIPRISQVTDSNSWLYLAGVVCCARKSFRQTLAPSASVILITDLLSAICRASAEPFDERYVDFCVRGVLAVTSPVLLEFLGEKLSECVDHQLSSPERSEVNLNTWLNLLTIVPPLLKYSDIRLSDPVLCALRRILLESVVIVEFDSVEPRLRLTMFNAFLRIMKGLKLGLDACCDFSGSVSSKYKPHKDDVVSLSADVVSNWMDTIIAVTSVVTIKIADAIQRRATVSPSPLADDWWVSIAHYVSQLFLVLESGLMASNGVRGPSIGSIGMVLRNLLYILFQIQSSIKHREKIATALRTGSRTLQAVSRFGDLRKYLGKLVAIIVDRVSGLEVSSITKELLLPGIFGLIDKCEMKEKKKIFSVLNLQAASMLRDLYEIYLRDFKFMGKA